MTRAREFSLAWWEAQGLAGIWSKDFNAHAYRLQMMNRFPDDWRDRQELEVSGMLRNLNLEALPDHLIARLAAGENPYSVLASAAAEGSALLRLASGSEETGES